MGSSKESTTGGFLKQGTILAVASIMVRIIGMIYRIPMANIIGDEGNGIYSAAYEIYNILLIISSYGMPMAVSKMVSARCAQKRYKNAYKLFRYSMAVSVVTGGAAALFVYFGADWLENQFFFKVQWCGNSIKDTCADYIYSSSYGYFKRAFPRQEDNASYSCITDI